MLKEDKDYRSTCCGARPLHDMVEDNGNDVVGRCSECKDGSTFEKEDTVDAKPAYTIFGKYRGRKEEIDTAETLKNAEYLVNEYQVAYGHDWTVWYE